MSSSSGYSNPHAHLIGAKASLTSEIQEELSLDWSEGVIASLMDTPRGIGVHLCNPETGAVTDALTMAALKLHPDTVKVLKLTGAMNAMALSQISEMLEREDFFP